MKQHLVAISLLMGTGAAFAQSGTACIFSAAELSATLGHTPEAGVASQDRLGTQMCKYTIKNAKLRGFSVHIKAKCDQRKFEIHAKMKQSTSGKANTPLKGYGDDAYFSPDGSAAARVGTQCVELSGFRGGAKRAPIASDAEPLLALAVSRVGKR